MNTQIPSVKEFLFITLNNTKESDQKKSRLQNLLNRLLYILILGNVLSMVLETVSYFQEYSIYFTIFEYFSLAIFAGEYFARIWTYKLHNTYKNISSFLFSPMMIFDALVFTPHLATIFFPNIIDLRILRIIRVFRIFRLYKYSNTIDKITDIIMRHKRVLLSAFSVIMMGVITTATLMYFAENKAQPEVFSSIPQAMYWSVITISTVGYGDFSPVTDLGKFIAMLTTIFGVAIYALPTSILGAAFYAELMSKESHLLNTLKKENKELEYLLHNAKREALTLRQKLKKERETERNTHDSQNSFFKKIFK